MKIAPLHHGNTKHGMEVFLPVSFLFWGASCIKSPNTVEKFQGHGPQSHFEDCSGVWVALFNRTVSISNDDDALENWCVRWVAHGLARGAEALRSVARCSATGAWARGDSGCSRPFPSFRRRKLPAASQAGRDSKSFEAHFPCPLTAAPAWPPSVAGVNETVSWFGERGAEMPERPGSAFLGPAAHLEVAIHVNWRNWPPRELPGAQAFGGGSGGREGSPCLEELPRGILFRFHAGS